MRRKRNEITFEELKEMLLYRKITQWDDNKIVLDNGVEIAIEETNHACCAWARGGFEDVKLDAAITDITPITYDAWEANGTYGCAAEVKFIHNQNVIGSAWADADAGNGGYYFSVASFVVTVPKGEDKLECHFVCDSDGEE